MSVLTTVKAEIEKLDKSIEREDSLNNQLENYRVLLETITEMEEQSKPLPDDVTFKNYEEWKEYVEKKIKSRKTSLKTLNKNKDIVVALNSYVEANSED